MTIHSGHPFAAPEPERDLARRLRGRLGGQVSVWAAGEGEDRVGLTVSALLVEPGDPPYLIGLIDPESTLAAHLVNRVNARLVVCLLEWRHRDLAEQLAGQMPAPGGPFASDSWLQTDHGPRIADAPTWFAATVIDTRDLGWRVSLTCQVEHIEIGVDDDPLLHRRGRYLRLGSGA